MTLSTVTKKHSRLSRNNLFINNKTLNRKSLVNKTIYIYNALFFLFDTAQKPLQTVTK